MSCTVQRAASANADSGQGAMPLPLPVAAQVSLSDNSFDPGELSVQAALSPR